MSDVNAIVQNTMAQYQTDKAAKPFAHDNGKAAIAAQEFEAVFISQMLAPMFEGIQPDPMFGGGNAENIYQSMMVEEYGKLIAAQGGIGLADAVKAEILSLQSQVNGEDNNGE
jgi:Rod binding domain-containing protein